MSRRNRIEEERLRHLNDEIEEEENRLKAQRERIYGPLIWRRLGSGIKIQDLKPAYFDQVLAIIQECYLDEAVLTRNTRMSEDPESTKSFLKFVQYFLRDHTSIIALDELNEDAIAGFLILKVMHKDDYSRIFSRVTNMQGEALRKCSSFINYLSRKFDIYTHFNSDSYLQYMWICITPQYRRKGLGLQLFSAGVDVARSLNVPVIGGIFPSWKLQKLAKKSGMTVCFEVNYVDWKDRFNEMIFEDPGVGNYTCAVMAGLLPPPPEEEQPPKIENNEEKMTREEKRKNKAKQKKK